MEKVNVLANYEGANDIDDTRPKFKESIELLRNTFNKTEELGVIICTGSINIDTSGFRAQIISLKNACGTYYKEVEIAYLDKNGDLNGLKSTFIDVFCYL